MKEHGIKTHLLTSCVVLLLLAALLLCGCSQSGDTEAKGVYNSLDELNGRRIGVQTGTTGADIVLERLPNAQISYYNAYSDLSAALKAKKIDGFPGADLVLKVMAAEDSELFVLDEMMGGFDCGIALPCSEKGDRLCEEWNAWIADAKESRELDEIIEKWTTGPEEERTVPDYALLPAVNGVLTCATDADFYPLNYYRGDELAGVEIDMCARFCEDYGYGLKFSVVNFDGILAGVQSGKYDFSAAAITVTEERRESVNFSDPYYSGGFRMAVLKAEDGKTSGGIVSSLSEFFRSLKESFEKTFIRENRWKLLAQGCVTTLFITVLAIVFGTVLGFAVYLACRKGIPFANTLTRFCFWLVDGMPGVVLLMILYYVIFGSVSISGTWVSVIAFTLVFGSAVYSMLKTGVGAVDEGQTEAACALGYSDRRAFFRVVLPQAVPHILPTYTGQVTSLIKATAVVGYIAVQDLTKMGDIIRSRTYEAFFPLIAVAVLYFILAGVLSFLVKKLGRLLDARQRRYGVLLKGVEIHD